MKHPFAPGDVVVCLDNSPHYSNPVVEAAYARLRKGKHYRVGRAGQDYLGNWGVDVGVANNDLQDGLNDIWPPRCFRHIDKADDTFTAEMRAMRPHREQVPA